MTWYRNPGNIPRITAEGKNVNVVVAAYVTTQDRLQLYEDLSELGESVLYCDTDSVIVIQNVDDPLKVRKGDYLGHLTDELEVFGSSFFIQEFVSGGPKNYAFSVFAPPLINVPTNAR